MYDRVLFPTDGSEGADVATEHAIEVANRFDAPIHAVYVVDMTALYGADAYSSPPLDPPLDALEAEGREWLERVSERADREDIDVTTAVEEGSPASAIVEAAEADDVIVMGTHGRTGLDRYLIGSTTEKVVRTADVPVLTVPVTKVDEPEESDERE